MGKGVSNEAHVSGRRKRRSAEELSVLILKAAAEEFSAHGFAGATTAAIARRAAVTEAQIFRLYPSKQDLFRAAVFQPLNHHFADFQNRNASADEAATSPRAAAEAYIDELQTFMAHNARMLMSLVVASAYEDGAAQALREIEGLNAYFDQGAAMMASRVGDAPRVDPRLMVRVSFAAVLGNVMFRKWLFPDGLADDEAVRQAIADFVIDGIRANEDAGLQRPKL